MVETGIISIICAEIGIRFIIVIGPFINIGGVIGIVDCHDGEGNVEVPRFDAVDDQGPVLLETVPAGIGEGPVDVMLIQSRQGPGRRIHNVIAADLGMLPV